MEDEERPESGSSRDVSPRTSRLMVVSLVLSVAGCYAFLAIIARWADSRMFPPLWRLVLPLLPGLAVGIVSVVQVARSGGRLVGMSLLGFVVVWVVLAIVLTFLFPIFVRLPKSYVDPCLSNLKQLGLAMMQYVQDYDETFPPTANWNEALMPYIKSDAVFHCPQAPDRNLPSYAMDWKLARLKLKQIREPDKAVSLFDSVPGRSLAGGPGLLPAPPRHSGGDQFSFADGHAKWYRRADVLKLRWDPKR